MKYRVAVAWAAIGCLGMLALTGCPPAPKGTGGQGATAQLVTAVKGGVVRLPLEIAIDDPVLKAMDLTDPRLFALARCLELPLTDRLSGQMASTAFTSAEPNAEATEWKMSLRTVPGHESEPDYLGTMITARFKQLLQGPVTPLREQLADLLEGATAFRDGRALALTGISSVGAVFTMRFTRTDVALAAWLSQPGLGIMTSQSVPGAGGFGPFVLAAVEGNELVLKPNPASLMGQPLLDELRFVCEPDRAKQLALYREGKLDAANLALGDLAAVKEDPALSASLVQMATAEQILGFFNQSRFPWGDSEFKSKQGLRQALNWGMDRADLQSLAGDQFTVWPYFLPKPMKDYVPPALLARPTYPSAMDLARAQDGLIRADHEQGSHLLPGMDLGYLASENLEPLARDILGYWEEISIRLRPFPMTAAELTLRVDRATHEIVLHRVRPAYADPDALAYPLLLGKFAGLGGNWSWLKNAQVDDLVIKSQGATDKVAREKYLQEIVTLIDEQSLFVFIGSATPTILVNPQLASYTLTPYDYDASLPAQDFAKLGRKGS